MSDEELGRIALMAFCSVDVAAIDVAHAAAGRAVRSALDPHPEGGE